MSLDKYQGENIRKKESESLEKTIESALRDVKKDCRTSFREILKIAKYLLLEEQQQSIKEKLNSRLITEIEDAARNDRPCSFSYEELKALSGKGVVFWIDPLKSGAINIPVRTKNKAELTTKNHPKGKRLTVYFDSPGKGKISIFEEVL